MRAEVERVDAMAVGKVADLGGSLQSEGRVDYTYATDDEALEAFSELARTEGIIPALETSHALAHVKKAAPAMRPDQIIVVSLSGRGDKDVDQAAKYLLPGV